MPDVKFSNLYPYTDFHELNLDWVIKEVKFWSERVGKSIQKIELTGTVGLVDTYTINYSDGTTSTFDVTNGAGIASITKTGTVGLVDTYTITLQDGSTSTFEVTNGTAAIDPTLTLSDYAADAKATGDRIANITDGLFTETVPPLTSGKYINATGGESSNANYSYSDYIPVRGIFKIKTCLAIGYVAYYDNSWSFISNQNVNDNYETYMTVPSNAVYFRFCNNHVIIADSDVRLVYVNARVTDYFNYDSNVLANKTLLKMTGSSRTPVMTSGKYIIRTTGNLGNLAAASYSDYVPTDNAVAIYTCDIGSVSGIAYYDENQTYISGQIVPSYIEWTLLEVPANAVYFRFSNMHTKLSDSDVKVYYKNADIADIDILGMFDNIICCGDSITAGQVYTSGGSYHYAANPYPAILQKLTGITVSKLAVAGYSAKMWWDAFNTNITTDGLYIIYLGTNLGLTDTIATDCVGSDPAAFADTQTGNYGKILQTITNNGYKAVLVKCTATSGASLATLNDVIDQFGVKYNFPVISIPPEYLDLNYHYFPDRSSYNLIHYNELGYAWLANAIRNQIAKLPTDEQFKLI